MMPDAGLMEDLASRFVSNVPQGEVQSFENAMFLVEEAHWFYEDFYRERDQKLKSLTLREFASLFCNACPELHMYLADGQFDAHFKYVSMCMPLLRSQRKRGTSRRVSVCFAASVRVALH